MLLDLMNANGVEKTVLVQVIHYRWDNSYAAKAIKDYPDKFMAVCRINPEDPDAPDHLSYWVEEHGIHGVRLSPSGSATDDWFTGPLMDPIFSRAEELGVPMLILTGVDRMPDLAAILDRHGDLDVSIDHMASAPVDDPDKQQLLLDMARFRGCTSKLATPGRLPIAHIRGRIPTTWSRKSIRHSAASVSCGERIGPSACPTRPMHKPYPLCETRWISSHPKIGNGYWVKPHSSFGILANSVSAQGFMVP